MRALGLLATSAVALGKWPEALRHADLGLSRLTPTDPPRTAVELLTARGACLVDLGRLAEARKAVEEAVTRSKAVAAPDLLTLSLKSRAFVRARQGDQAGAVEDGLAAREAAERSGDPLLAAETLAELGILYDELGDLEPALACFTRALPVFEKAGAVQSQAATLHNVARIHLARERFDEAAAAYRRSRDLSKKAGDESGVAYAVFGLGSIESRRGDPAVALATLRSALASFEGLGDARMRYAALVEIGRLERKRGRPAAARLSLERALEAAYALESDHETGLAHRELALTLADEGRFAEAYRHLLEAGALRDRAADAGKSREATELRVRFESELRQRENLLLQRDVELERLGLAEERRRRILFACAAVGGLLLAGFLAVGAVHDARLRRKLAEQATTDDLTGLLNRRATLAALEREVKAAGRHRTPLSVALVDLDRFKSVNDEFGHAAGDEALVAFGRLCRSTLRLEDSFGRWGGEEFLLVFRQTGAAEARAVLERLREGMRGLSLPRLNGERQLTMSAGLAVLLDGETGVDGLLKRADEALYAAKQKGRDRIEVAPA